MPAAANCRLIKRVAEFVPRALWKNVPDGTRGIYTLQKQDGRNVFNVVYVGMAGGRQAGIWSRLESHNRSKSKKWTHFSVFEVHDNLMPEDVREIEGLLRHLYRKTTYANHHNKQVRHGPFTKIRVHKDRLRKEEWGENV
jgi:hypothetical protein